MFVGHRRQYLTATPPGHPEPQVAADDAHALPAAIDGVSEVLDDRFTCGDARVFSFEVFLFI